MLLAFCKRGQRKKSERVTYIPEMQIKTSHRESLMKFLFIEYAKAENSIKIIKKSYTVWEKRESLKRNEIKFITQQMSSKDEKEIKLKKYFNNFLFPCGEIWKRY